MTYKRKKDESFMDYAERLIKGQQDNIYDLDKNEIYELLYGTKVSSDHARKALKILEMTIELNKMDEISGNIALEETAKIKNYKNTVELNKDGSQSSSKLIEMSENQAKDISFLLKAHGYSVDCWELVSAKNNIWNVYSKQDGINTLYSSKITVKPKQFYSWNEEDVRKIFENVDTSDYKKDTVPSLNYSNDGNMLIIPIVDLHYNLLSDSYTTGNIYNIKIAYEVYYYILNDIIERVKDKKIEKILFVVGNDFINADNINGTTTNGTQQDNERSWFSIINNATQLIINGIEMLLQIAPVNVLYVPSNHDLHTMFGIIQTVKAWYKNDNFVNIVDDSPLPRKYYQYGKVLLGFSHDIKIKDGLKIMTTEAKDEWSQCENMIWMLAHKHQGMVYDKQGYLEIFRLPTASGWSRWTNGKGYMQTDKRNKSFIINKELGIINELNTVIK